MDDAEFEWDEAKDLSNQKKHGISFEDAARVFGDPLMVVHTYRDHDDQEKIRIISARMATRHERQAYERENS